MRSYQRAGPTDCRSRILRRPLNLRSRYRRRSFRSRPFLMIGYSRGSTRHVTMAAQVPRELACEVIHCLRVMMCALIILCSRHTNYHQALLRRSALLGRSSGSVGNWIGRSEVDGAEPFRCFDRRYYRPETDSARCPGR